jgi:DDE superfamily endonuclease
MAPIASTSLLLKGDDAVDALFDTVLQPLARQDQRMRGEQYVRGLLSARGRKSMRNIAAQIGGGPVQQSLQHFLNSSSWDWLEVRQTLSRHLEQQLTHRAWVVQSLVLPKSGSSSVGVESAFVPELGRRVNSQQAYGVWFASEYASVPVNWGLFLPPTWLSDELRRQKAGIPSEGEETTLGGCACRAVLMVEDWQTPHRPVVLDVGALDAEECLRRFSAVGLPVLLRVGQEQRMYVADSDAIGYGQGELTVQQILGPRAGQRRQVSWTDPRDGLVRSSLAAAVPVRLSEETGRVALLAEWGTTGSAPSRLWLTNMVDAPLSALIRTTKLVLRVKQDFSRISEQVGVRDFEGRSYRGWHRHMTLASVAHAAVVLGAEVPVPPRDRVGVARPLRKPIPNSGTGRFGLPVLAPAEFPA